MISELVGDAGERLVYRAQMYAKSDILGYKPAHGDLAYPQKLIMMESITKSNSNSSATSIPTGETTASVDSKDILKRQSSVGSIVSATSQEVASLTSNQSKKILTRKMLLLNENFVWFFRFRFGRRFTRFMVSDRTTNDNVFVEII